MGLIGTIISWLGARLIPIGASAAAILALVAWDYVRIDRAERRGEDRAEVRTERNNAKVDEIGSLGADNGGKPVPGSVLDPRYRR